MSNEYERQLRKIKPPFGGDVQFGPAQGRGERILLTDFAFTDRQRHVWIAKANLVTDGASVPSFLRFAIGKPFDAPQIFSGLVHDSACKDVRDDYDARRIDWDACIGRRKIADEMFHQACLGAGMNAMRAQVFYCGVRIGASFGAGMPERRSDGDVVNSARVFALATKGLKLPAAGERSLRPRALAKGSKMSARSAKAASDQQEMATQLMARYAQRRGAKIMSRSFEGTVAARAMVLEESSAELLARETFERVQKRLKGATDKSLAKADREILAAMREID